MELFEEFIETAEESLQKGRYTAAVRNYATAIFLLIDKYLKEEHNILVKNHTDRFNKLEELARRDSRAKKLLEIYELVFEVYRKTYYIPLPKEQALLLKKYVEDARKLVE